MHPHFQCSILDNNIQNCDWFAATIQFRSDSLNIRYTDSRPWPYGTSDVYRLVPVARRQGGGIHVARVHQVSYRCIRLIQQIGEHYVLLTDRANICIDSGCLMVAALIEMVLTPRTLELDPRNARRPLFHLVTEDEMIQFIGRQMYARYQRTLAFAGERFSAFWINRYSHQSVIRRDSIDDPHETICDAQFERTMMRVVSIVRTQMSAYSQR